MNKKIENILDKCHEHISGAAEEIVKELKQECETYKDLDYAISRMVSDIKWKYSNKDKHESLFNEIEKLVEYEKSHLKIDKNLSRKKDEGGRYMCGMDYGNGKDKATLTIHINANTTELKGKLDEIEEQLDRINNKSEVLDYGELYAIGTSTLGMSVDEISNTAIKEMAEIAKDAMRMLIYKE